MEKKRMRTGTSLNAAKGQKMKTRKKRNQELRQRTFVLAFRVCAGEIHQDHAGGCAVFSAKPGLPG